MTRVLWPPFKLLFKALTVSFPAALVVAALAVATVATAASLVAAVADIAPGAPQQAAPPLRPPPWRARLRPLGVARQFERPAQQPLCAHRTQIARHRLAVADAVQRQGAACQHIDHTA